MNNNKKLLANLHLALGILLVVCALSPLQSSFFAAIVIAAITISIIIFIKGNETDYNKLANIFCLTGVGVLAIVSLPLALTYRTSIFLDMMEGLRSLTAIGCLAAGIYTILYYDKLNKEVHIAMNEALYEKLKKDLSTTDETITVEEVIEDKVVEEVKLDIPTPKQTYIDMENNYKVEIEQKKKRSFKSLYLSLAISATVYCIPLVGLMINMFTANLFAIGLLVLNTIVLIKAIQLNMPKIGTIITLVGVGTGLFSAIPLFFDFAFEVFDMYMFDYFTPFGSSNIDGLVIMLMVVSWITACIGVVFSYIEISKINKQNEMSYFD